MKNFTMFILMPKETDLQDISNREIIETQSKLNKRSEKYWDANSNLKCNRCDQEVAV